VNRSVKDIDAALLDRIRQDDQEAFRELYKRYWKRCYLQVLRRSGDPELAEDVTQNVFVSFWEKRRTADVRNVEAYLYTAVRFRFISYVKSQLQAAQYQTHFSRANQEDQNPVDTFLRLKELSEAIDKGVAMMSPKTKEVYTLSRKEHFSVKEIAEKLNLSEKAVEYHITQSLKTLRLALKDFFPLLVVLLEIFS